MIDLIIKAQNGDMDATETLLKENDSLVRHFMKQNFISVFNEDYHSVGRFGLYKAIMSYDVNKGIEFSTYAGKLILNELYQEIRRSKAKKNEIFETAVTIEHPIGDGLVLGDTIQDYRSYQEFLDTEAPRIMESLHVLDELEQKIFMLRFIEDMTIPEIIETLGLSWSNTYGSRKIAIIKAKLALVLGIEYESKTKVYIKRFEKGLKGEVK